MRPLAPFPADFDPTAWALSRERVLTEVKYSVHAGRKTQVGRVRVLKAQADEKACWASFVCPYCERQSHPTTWRDHLAHCVAGRDSGDVWRCGGHRDPCVLCDHGPWFESYEERVRLLCPELFAEQGVLL